MTGNNIYLLNDSFPPLVDGVATTVVNYAKELLTYGMNPSVFVPRMKGMDDRGLDYPVIRYPSIDVRKHIGYYVGVPLSARMLSTIHKNPPTVLHCHCPGASILLAKSIRTVHHAPLILTYHTKFDMDIHRTVKQELISKVAIKSMIEWISSCDEVWTVSKGAGENLRSLGYEGDYIVMENGVDVEKARVADSEIRGISEEYALPCDVPVYLFVGRMYWYKGQKVILDALAKLKAAGRDFRMIFVGDGGELPAIKEYADNAGLGHECVFTGIISEREKLRAIYCRADLFLFPSEYDTNGLVVREAAASSLASVLIEGSCAAEGVTDGKNGFLIANDGEALYQKLLSLYDRRDELKDVGQCAADELYLSWHDAVGRAIDRYRVVEEAYLAKHGKNQ